MIQNYPPNPLLSSISPDHSKEICRCLLYRFRTVCCRENVREISTGDKLFVPSGGAVSWRAKGGGRADGEAIALRFCYVDASNFNSVKSNLPLYAAVEVRCTLTLD